MQGSRRSEPIGSGEQQIAQVSPTAVAWAEVTGSIPGVSAISVAAILAETGDPSRGCPPPGRWSSTLDLAPACRRPRKDSVTVDTAPRCTMFDRGQTCGKPL